MRKHHFDLPPEDIYPIDEWKILQTDFVESMLGRDETMFATSNGYIGMRGNFTEERPYVERGVFINGFYESWPIEYGEKAYGFAENGQTMVPVPDAGIIKMYVDDEPLYLPTVHLLEFRRELDMKESTLNRSLIWETGMGKKVRLTTKRIVSMEYRHLVAIDYELEVLNASANIVLSSKIGQPERQPNSPGEEDPRKSKLSIGKVFEVENERAHDARIIYGYRAKRSGMTLACGKDHVVETENEYERKMFKTNKGGKIVYEIDAQEKKPFNLKVYIAYHHSRYVDPKDLLDRCERTLNRSIDLGWDKLIEAQRAAMDAFWDKSDIKLETDFPRAQQVMRFNLFHICQASARVEGTGIGARGLTGSAYDGHYFWDTEIYVLPFLIYTCPRIAWNLLRFRYSILPQACERANQVNQKGALFPWRTINGEEASAFFAAGTAQYHINADIMYAMKKYVAATQDEAFLCEYGAEMLVQTARLWMDLGSYPQGDGDNFHIHGVTGPDEYTALVNNNLFTNMMARENLRYAAEVVKLLKEKYPQYMERLSRETQLDMKEVEDWCIAADRMYIPYDEKRQIHPQDDNFLERDRWDFDNTPIDKYPLLLHFHPLVIYRHQVIKQADVVMALFLLGHQFTHDEKRRNFDYYDALTTGDSSLSACIQGIVASELGYDELAQEYYNHTAMMDFADVGKNAVDGCHIAAMGGSWMSCIYGMAGFRDCDETPAFHPRLTPDIKRMQFTLTIRGQVIDVDMSMPKTTYFLREGEGITIKHKEKTCDLKPQVAVTV